MSLRFQRLFIFTVLAVMTGFASTSVHAANSYLFGRTPIDGLGRADQSTSERYARESSRVLNEGYVALERDYGSPRPTELRILIKDDALTSRLTQTYVDTLAQEKPNLMRLYQLSNQDYNRLAAIAFGILGKETKFGTSGWYLFKEANQKPIPVTIAFAPTGLKLTPFHIPSLINLGKLRRKKMRDLDRAIVDRDPGLFLDVDTWVTPPNSRGLTQIKSIPKKISRFYCVNSEQLRSPRVAAIATLGFLAESLKITATRAKNQKLTYVTKENIFDYVLYVYFGSIRQLAEPRLEIRRVQLNPNLESDKNSVEQLSDYVKWAFFGGPALDYAPRYRTQKVQVNATATPDRNTYIQYVKRYIGALALYEADALPFRSARNNACAVPRNSTK